MNANTRALLCLLAGLMLGYVLETRDPPLVGPHAVLGQAAELTAFSQDWEVVTPDDETQLARQPRALFICDADGGDIDMAPWRSPNATPATFPVSGGVIYPLSPSIIAETTTVDCIIALY